MADMRLRDLQHHRFHRLHLEPLWHLMAQHAVAHGDRAALIALFALARHHKDQPFTTGVGAHHKSSQRGMRAIQRHTVQIELPFGAQLTAPELGKGFLIHLNLRLADLVVDRGRKVMRWRRLASSGPPKDDRFRFAQSTWRGSGIGDIYIRIKTLRLKVATRDGLRLGAHKVPKLTILSRQATAFHNALSGSKA